MLVITCRASHLILYLSPPVGTQELLPLVLAGAGDTLKGWGTSTSGGRGLLSAGFTNRRRRERIQQVISAKWHTDFSKPASYHLHLHHQELEGRTEGCGVGVRGWEEVNDGRSLSTDAEKTCGWEGEPLLEAV